MKSAERLEWLLDHIPARLQVIPETEFTRKPAPGKWSKKEITGHLADSAANNHHRFIRAQFEQPFQLQRYAQNEWVEFNRYQELESGHVIRFWETYNRHLLEVIRRIPEERLLHECITPDAEVVTLGWLIDDYVSHLEHHLNQLTDIS